MSCKTEIKIVNHFQNNFARNTVETDWSIAQSSLLRDTKHELFYGSTGSLSFETT